MRVEGPITPFQNSEYYGSSDVNIFLVDGLVADFEASSPGANWFASKQPLYLAPGKHTLFLKIAEIETTKHGNFASGNRPTITVQFAASRVYRFTANLSVDKKAIDVTLWDETGGTAKRSSVAKWTFDSNWDYTRNFTGS